MYCELSDYQQFTVCVSSKDFKDRKKFEGKQKRQRCALNDFTSVHSFGYGTVGYLHSAASLISRDN